MFFNLWEIGHIAEKLCFTRRKRKYIKTKDDSSILKDKRTSMAAVRDLYHLHDPSVLITDYL
jgi:hypothetical protein